MITLKNYNTIITQFKVIERKREKESHNLNATVVTSLFPLGFYWQAFLFI